MVCNFIYLYNVLIVILLLGNKYDLFDQEEVKEESGTELAESIGATFLLTSAKMNTEIPEIPKIIVDKCKEVFGEPETWNFETSNLQISDKVATNPKKNGGCCDSKKKG